MHLSAITIPESSDDLPGGRAVALRHATGHCGPMGSSGMRIHAAT